MNELQCIETLLSHTDGLLNHFANFYGLLHETNCETAKLVMMGLCFIGSSPRKGN